MTTSAQLSRRSTIAASRSLLSIAATVILAAITHASVAKRSAVV